VQEKFKRFPLAGHARIDVIRHRSRSLFHTTLDLTRRATGEAAEYGREVLTAVTGHGRRLLSTVTATRGRAILAAALAVLFVTGGALMANAAVSDRGPGPELDSVPPAAALLERDQATETPDRGERDRPMGRDRATETEDASSDAKGSTPESSPSPSPERSERSEQKSTPQTQRPQPSPSPKRSAAPENKPSPKPSASPSPKRTEAPKWVHPMPGASTTSCFGWRWGAMHAGVDLAAPHGTPIRAVGAGTVTNAGWVFSGYGISVVIDHGDGYYTHYAHASEAKVSPGDKVKPGQIIALEGSTGDSTGPHLHFEVHKGMWNQVEPTEWLSNRGVHIGGC
jgi:murein DD-endopeptidase MepM/ murein hydrolase activator NlpD